MKNPLFQPDWSKSSVGQAADWLGGIGSGGLGGLGGNDSYRRQFEADLKSLAIERGYYPNYDFWREMALDAAAREYFQNRPKPRGRRPKSQIEKSSAFHSFFGIQHQNTEVVEWIEAIDNAPSKISNRQFAIKFLVSNGYDRTSNVFASQLQTMLNKITKVRKEMGRPAHSKPKFNTKIGRKRK